MYESVNNPEIIEIHRKETRDYIYRDFTDDKPNTELYHLETSLVIPNIGEALLYHPPEVPDTVHLTALKVSEEYRGQQLASLLFESTLDFAHEKNFQYLQTIAANERTAKLFRRFDDKQLFFMQKKPGTLEYEPAHMTSIDEVVDYLAFCRELGAVCGDRDDDQLTEHIAITAKLDS